MQTCSEPATQVTERVTLSVTVGVQLCALAYGLSAHLAMACAWRLVIGSARVLTGSLTIGDTETCRWLSATRALATGKPRFPFRRMCVSSR